MYLIINVHVFHMKNTACGFYPKYTLLLKAYFSFFDSSISFNHHNQTFTFI